MAQKRFWRGLVLAVTGFFILWLFPRRVGADTLGPDIVKRVVVKDHDPSAGTIRVDLQVNLDTARDIRISEGIPEETTAVNVSSGGTLLGNRIVWVILSVSQAKVSYDLARTTPCRGTLFLGPGFFEIGGVRCSITGEDRVDCEAFLPVQVKDAFRRGDVDASGVVELTDAVRLLGHLFLGDGNPPCLEAGDADDNGVADISDAVGILVYLFQGGLPPADPGPTSCGSDPTPDAPGLGCQAGCP